MDPVTGSEHPNQSEAWRRGCCPELAEGWPLPAARIGWVAFLRTSPASQRAPRGRGSSAVDFDQFAADSCSERPISDCPTEHQHRMTIVSTEQRNGDCGGGKRSGRAPSEVLLGLKPTSGKVRSSAIWCGSGQVKNNLARSAGSSYRFGIRPGRVIAKRAKNKTRSAGDRLAQLSLPPSPGLPPLPRLRRTGRRAGPGLAPRGSDDLTSALADRRSSPSVPRPKASTSVLIGRA